MNYDTDTHPNRWLAEPNVIAVRGRRFPEIKDLPIDIYYLVNIMCVVSEELFAAGPILFVFITWIKVHCPSGNK